MRRVHDVQGRIVLILEGTLPPGADGPPLHVHIQEHEEGVVKAGTLGALVGAEKIIVPTGETVTLPAGIAHRWWNAGDDLLEFKRQVVPVVDLDRYLQACLLFSTPALTQAIDLPSRARAVAPSRHTVNGGSRPSYSADRFAGGSVYRANLGQIPRIELAGSPESCPGAPLVDANGLGLHCS
jgi:quercetin dioxygenase-like cupin family protein